MTSQDLNLKPYTAVVCGSSQGIGKGLAALALLHAWVVRRIVLAARDRERPQEVILELQAINDQAHTALIADFSHPETLESALQSFTQA